jgi:hypothetical protein
MEALTEAETARGLETLTKSVPFQILTDCCALTDVMRSKKAAKTLANLVNMDGSLPFEIRKANITLDKRKAGVISPSYGAIRPRKTQISPEPRWQTRQ